jgi:hypothetical protein
MREKLKAYEQTFKNPQGEKILKDLEERFLNQVSYWPEENQPYMTYYREGQREVVRYIKQLLEINPERPTRAKT